MLEKATVFIITYLTITISLVHAIFDQNILDILSKQSVLYGISTVVRNDSKVLCYRELGAFQKSVKLKHPWALKVLDSSGIKSSGFYDGNNLWLGFPSQCLDTMNQKPYEVSPELRPKPTENAHPPFPIVFAVAYFHQNNSLQFHGNFPQENKIQLGLCIPASCSKFELENIVNEYLENTSTYAEEILDINLQLTRVKILNHNHDWMLRSTSLYISAIFAFGIAMVIIGTCCDVLKRKKDENCNVKHFAIDNNNAPMEKGTGIKEDRGLTLLSVLIGFSIFRNIPQLLKTKKTTTANNIPMLHGLRVLGMIWVISVHAIYFQQDAIDNAAAGLRISEQFAVQWVSNSTYCVDTFLLMSGFLVSYLFYKSKIGIFEKTRRPEPVLQMLIEWISLMINRILRLTPVYIYAVAISTYLTIFAYEESVFDPTERNDLLCEKYWWRNILYVNNLYPRKEMCLSWSWYLSADTQFFLISTIILFLSTRYLKFSLFLIMGTIITCMGVMGYITYSVDYIPYLDQQYAKMDALYDMPWNRIGPYLIGILTGYIYVIPMKEKMVLGKKWLLLCWIVFPSIIIWIIFSIYGRDTSLEYSAFYMGTSRTLWGVAIAWLIIVCSTDNAKLLNNFLSHPFWIPLSKITYCAYLLNPLIVLQSLYLSDSIIHISLSKVAVSLNSYILLTYSIAFIFCILFECPYVNLTKKLLKLVRNSRRKKVSNDRTNYNHELAGEAVRTKI